MAVDQLPPPFCPACGQHGCPYPTPEAHKPKRRRWRWWPKRRR